MDLRSLLNGAPAQSSASSTTTPSRPMSHPPPTPQSHRPPPPPPLQSPHSPFQSQQGGRFAPPPQQSPYRVSPSSQGYPFPPRSPHGQQAQQQQQQHSGYIQSPIGTPHGTPHPLSAHSTIHSATPTSAASPTSQHQFPGQNQPHQYAMQQGPLHTPPIHTPPSPMNQFGPHTHQHGYPRQSPMASPVDGRTGAFHPPPSIATPSRDRERERSVLRDRERDISISPKTKVPFLADEEPSPAGATPAKERQSFGIDAITGGPPTSSISRPSSQHQHHPQPPMSAEGGQYRRDSSVGTSTLERQSMDIDEPERKWSSPVSDRSKTNGSGAEVGEHHNNNHHRGSQGPSSNSSLHRGPPPSLNTKEQPSTAPMPTPASVNRPASPSSKVQQPQQTLGPPPTPTQQTSPVDGRSGSPGSGGPPRKRLRREEAPIWARKASRSSSSSPVMAAKRQPSSVQSAHLSSQQQHQQAPGPPPPPPPGPPSQQSQQPPQASPQPQGLQSQPPGRGGIAVIGLGPWEPSIKGVEVMDELSMAVADFLYANVVCQNDPALISDGGALIEIEAKIGQLVDKNTNERLRLPVTTETAMNRDDPSLRIQFRSSMTEAQHKGYNIFLNRMFSESKVALPKAQNPPADDAFGMPRIPMEYAHTRERDSFFELPSDKYHILPPSIRATLNPRHKLRVRVTTDQKTGRVLKKIVKARIADLNIYSPSFAFDWRVSVNMEMPYEGDTEKLYPLGGGTGGSDGDRNKDRMSYRHLTYQVDLTQVTDKTAKKEHELEVEVNAKEIRKHGIGAMDKRPNAYRELVKGFVDNVRLLIREIA